MSDDFVVQVLDRFTMLTGRLVCSPADYQQAMEWESTGMPVQIALTTLDAEIRRNAEKPWLRRMQLAWANPAVLEAYENWRRAVGPSYRKG